MDLAAPELPVVANVSGEFYPSGPGVVDEMIEILGRQVASPVQFVKGLHTLFDAGARVFIETGPKRALQGFASDVLGDQEALNLFANHPKQGDIASLNQALCGLWAAGLRRSGGKRLRPLRPRPRLRPSRAHRFRDDKYSELGHMFADFLEKGRALLGEGLPTGRADTDPVAITGAAVGLPGVERMFDEAAVPRLLHGQQFIDVIPSHIRHEMLDKHITRLVKGEDGSGRFEAIDDPAEVIKLAARGSAPDMAEEFGLDPERVKALGHETRMAIAAGIDALRDAGIPLILRYKTTSTGSSLPDHWVLPEELRDDTGVIFASAFPGFDDFAGTINRFWEDRARRDQLAELETLRSRLVETEGDHGVALAEIDHRIHDLELELQQDPFEFDRRFLFQVLSMGHSQFAELIGARGPNTQINSACASTTQAVALAEDWIHAGRCRRVVIVAADDATSEQMLPWVGSGFLASGAAATDEVVEEAALPFDQRRHGMLLGMGAAGIVVESGVAARERGIQPICEVLGSVTANSAFHGTRLDVSHISQVMEKLVSQAEGHGIRRDEIAAETVFVSHETYTPARGGSAAAEIHALRDVFGDAAGKLVIANVKGYTGHPMGVGLEDILAIKSLETGLVPAVPNYREVDPELGELNLSKGGAYPIRYALRLAAGFGSQISMTLLRWTPVRDGSRREPEALGWQYRVADDDTWNGWLRRISGQDAPQLEVVKHQLRVADRGAVPTPAPAPPAAGPAPEPVVAEPVVADDDLLVKVLDLVAEQTGYPSDLLDPELDLEADLGIDTVKQAEMFATIREAWGIERDDNLKLRDYPTLNHVVSFVRERAGIPEHQATEAPAPAAADVGDDVLDRVLDLVAEQTGYPSDLLDPELDLEADLGIDTVKQAEMFATIREAWGIERDDSLKLRDYPTLSHVAGFVRERSGAPAAEPAEDDDVLARVLDLVAEQTGYPSDLLDPELDLEADLGIDTVKQAEMFATIREAWGIERDDSLKLRDYPTLNHVAGFVQERAGVAPAETGEEAPAEAADTPEPPASDGGFPRRVPAAVLRPQLDRCVPTGVELGEGTRVLLMPDQGGVAKALEKRLAKLGVEVIVAEPDRLEEQLTDAGEIHGVYWLPALDDEGPLAKLDAESWQAGLHLRVKLLAIAMRALAEQDPFLISATRLGGRHGYDADGATSVMGGAVSGFTKALGREREETLVKAVDFPASRKTAALAGLLVEETLRDPGAVEIGHADDLRWTVTLVQEEVEPQPERELSADQTFVITGAAGSIVSAITQDLAAAAGGGSFHLLDLVAEPDPGDPDLERFVSDKDGLKRDLADRLKERGDKPTPKLIERDLAAIERARAALDAIEAVRAAGGEAHWHQVDLTDPEHVARAIEPTGDRIDVLLHAAGLEISHFLPDKPQREYDLVFDVKANGWFNLVHALGSAEVGAMVVFSSIAGRFGNGGQTDYSAANDLLCKGMSALRRGGNTRGVAIDWTAWAGIGMASRGSIPKMMEMAGIDMLPAEIGVPIVRRELTAGGNGGEVLVGGSLGILEEERHETGGLDVADTAKTGPMTGQPAAMTVGNGLSVMIELDPERQAFLSDHRIDGTPVLPGVMGIEGFAEAALAWLPGWHATALEDVDLLAPVKFYRDEPRTLELRLLMRDGGEGTIVADCSLIGRRELPGKGEQETVHFKGRARLSRVAPEAPDGSLGGPDGDGAEAVEHDAVYRVYFHGPAYQVVDRAWRSNAHAIGRLATDLPPDHEPSGEPLEMSPRLIELCFQTAGLWELGTEGRMALPTHVDRVTAYAPSEDGGPLFAVVVRRDDGGVDAEVVDGAGRVQVRLEGYRTIELPGGVEADALAPIRAAMSG